MDFTQWLAAGLGQVALVATAAALLLWRRASRGELERASLRTQCEAAVDGLARARSALEGRKDPAQIRTEWLAQRISELSEDDAVEATQRLVFAHELAASSALAEHVSAGGTGEAPGDEATLWREAREHMHACAVQLIGDFPTAAQSISTLYDSVAAWDIRLDVDLPAFEFPDAAGGDSDADADADAVALTVQVADLTSQLQTAKDQITVLESSSDDTPGNADGELQAALEARDQELAEARARVAELEALVEAGAVDSENSEDLKNLLQQFTRESRDMLECIQELEQKNYDLEQRLAEHAGAEA